MDHLIQEVDEELRRERLYKLWRSFGKHIVVITVLILGMTSGIVAWRGYQDAQQQKWTDILLKAQEEMSINNPQAAIKLLERTSPAMQGNLQTIAQIWLAQLHLQQNHIKKADEVLAQAASHGSDDYSAFAALLHSGETATSNTVFASLSHEKQAIALLNNGKNVEALKALKALEQDAATNESTRARINLLLLQLEDKRPAPNAKPTQH